MFFVDTGEVAADNLAQISLAACTRLRSFRGRVEWATKIRFSVPRTRGIC